MGDRERDATEPFDISKIGFDKLRQEFTGMPNRNATVQSLKAVIEQRLRRMLAQNPLRTDFQQRYEEIVEAYNREKDRVTIERIFEELLQLERQLASEERRTVREGLDEESLAVFDLLRKPDLGPADIRKIKSAVGHDRTDLRRAPAAGAAAGQRGAADGPGRPGRGVTRRVRPAPQAGSRPRRHQEDQERSDSERQFSLNVIGLTYLSNRAAHSRSHDS